MTNKTNQIDFLEMYRDKLRREMTAMGYGQKKSRTNDLPQINLASGNEGVSSNGLDIIGLTNNQAYTTTRQLTVL